MQTINLFIRLKQCVELKKSSKNIDYKKRNIICYFSEKYKARNIICYLSEQHNPRNAIRTFRKESGGGLGTIFVGLAAILLAFVIFINVADYALFTYKRNAISKAMDYAITASVQQINKNKSVIGLANGFNEEIGKGIVEDVEIDIDMATSTFLTVFYENYKSDSISIDNNLLVCATFTHDGKLSYTIKADSIYIIDGILEDSTLIEDKINQAIAQYWNSAENNSKVYLKGNPKTNMLENGTYLLAYINNFRIKGLYSQRNINLSSFAGAKIERLVGK